MATVISAEAYRRLKDKVARYERAREHFDPKRFKRGGGYSVDDQRAIVKAAGLKQAPTNDDREDVAVYEFVRDKPEQLFCYIDGPHRRAKLWSDRSVIGTVELGRDYKTPAFGEASTRVPVKVHAINGCDYAGTYFKSSGDYARLKRVACAAPASAGVGQGGGGHGRSRRACRRWRRASRRIGWCGRGRRGTG
jgi:hypothetical protein